MSIVARAPSVVDPAGITGKVAATVYGQQLQIGEASQCARKNQVVKRERGIERISQNVVEVEMGQAFAMGESVRMHHDEGGFGWVTVTDLGSRIHVRFSGRNQKDEEKIFLDFSVPAQPPPAAGPVSKRRNTRL